MHEGAGLWSPVVYEVLARPAHHNLKVAKWGRPHPRACGFRLSFGLLKGQSADWRFTTHDGKSIHVREYGDHYTVHWDRIDPHTNLIGHLIVDSPEVLWAAAVIGLGTWACRKGVRFPVSS